MARQPRLQVANGTYHVTGKANRNDELFRDDADRDLFLVTLDGVVRIRRWTCLAYCLLTTHYHLVIRTPEPDLAIGMQRLNGLFAQAFNRRHREGGHVFGGRYYSKLVVSQTHFLELFRYVARNPVRAGICISPAQWLWSSYAATVGLARSPCFLSVSDALEQFGADPERAREALRAFVEEPS